MREPWTSSTVLFVGEREILCLFANLIFQDQVEQGAVNLISADLTRIPGAHPLEIETVMLRGMHLIGPVNLLKKSTIL
jgi:hypothetical protein